VIATSELDARSILFSRVFDAPRELVFETWTKPEHVARWFGPDGFTLTTYRMNVRPGGTWRFTMHGPDGTDYENRIDYLEVVRPDRLVYDQGEGDSGPANFRVTVEFRQEGAKTRLSARMVFPTADARNFTVEKYGAIEGAEQTMGRLAEYLKAIE